MKVLHYTHRWLDLSMAYVHTYVTGSRHPGVVVAREGWFNRASFPSPRPISLRALERLPGHSLRSAALEAVALGAAVDVVHVHLGYAAPDVLGLVQRNDLPLVLSLHGDDVTGFVSSRRGFYDDIIPVTTRVVAPSQFLAARIADLGFPADQIDVVPSGVDTSFFAPDGVFDGPPTVAFVGRFVPKKGLDVLMEAWPAVRTAVPSAQLHVVGSGGSAPTGPGVSWEPPSVANRRGQVRAALRASTVVCTPSRTAPDGDAESLLLVNLEAAACGRAVVTTRHGGIPEYVQEGVTAMVVSENDPSALADALITVLSDPGLAASLGAAGVEWAARFDVRACTAARDDVVSALAPALVAPALGYRADVVRPNCSVILPTRDRPAKLDRALASIVPALRAGDELVVVDSASTDPAVAAVAVDRGARVVRCDLPGVNRARNAGWRATTHEVMLYVDDDVVVDAGWADAFVAAMDAHPAAGFVAGRIEVPPGQAVTQREVAIKDGPVGSTLNAATEGVLGHSASLAVRRRALADIGGWDEAMGSGGVFKSSPELDLFDRLFAAGWVGWYEPAARAWHDQWRGKAAMLRLDWRYGYGAGARMAKLVRTDRRRAATLASSVYGDGLRSAATHARRGWKTPLLLDVAGLAGATVGLARALTVRVKDGHFVTR